MKPLDAWIYFCTHEYGCVLCRRNGEHSYADYHHMLVSGRRVGDYYGFGLCPTHHRSGSKTIVSRDQNKRGFERVYGPETAMHAEVKMAYMLFLSTKVIPVQVRVA